MRRFMIVTPEGQTYAPNVGFDVENLQVLGVVTDVKNKDEAIIKLLKENPWIIDAEFNASEFMVYELL